ncbi:hypothetical protein LTR85_002353 [Meristemomyces frigidus]|nr:hypothetical protein LTR85_002353 [Meristemomyces frigidus]
MKAAFFALGLPALTLAFPGMMGIKSKQEGLQMLEKMKREADAELVERQSLSSILSTVVSDVKGLIGSVASSVEPDNYRPEPGYTFQAPGPNDSRGPCPGLNLLANYGYLPRNGYVNFGQVIDATSRGFNMGADLSGLLAVFAILTNGDIATESFYLGTGPGNVGGLNRHDTVEADISPNREDFYLGCGDNHHLSSRLFTQNVALAAASSSKQFDLTVMGNQYYANSKFSQKYNPYLYYFPFPSIVSIGAFVFYPNFFSNGTYGAGGVANYESISSIIGAQFNSKTGHFEYVPERWPAQGWYRRSTEYGAVDALTEALAYIYAKNPVGMPIAQLGTQNLNVNTILCDAVEGINSVTPLALAGQAEEVEAGIAWALGALGAVGLNNTVLGCPTSALSANYLYGNSTQKGGPLNPPPSVQANTGNDVFNKVYFTTAPTTPQCSHTASS